MDTPGEKFEPSLPAVCKQGKIGQYEPLPTVTECDTCANCIDSGLPTDFIVCDAGR